MRMAMHWSNLGPDQEREYQSRLLCPVEPPCTRQEKANQAGKNPQVFKLRKQVGLTALVLQVNNKPAASAHMHFTHVPLSFEGVSQMDSILPERLLALVRPGCKIETPRYACNLAPGCISSEPTFAGPRKNKKKGPQKRGPKRGKGGFLWQSLTSLPGAKLRRISRGLYFAASRLHAAF